MTPQRKAVTFSLPTLLAQRFQAHCEALDRGPSSVLIDVLTDALDANQPLYRVVHSGNGEPAYRDGKRAQYANREDAEIHAAQLRAMGLCYVVAEPEKS